MIRARLASATESFEIALDDRRVTVTEPPAEHAFVSRREARDYAADAVRTHLTRGFVARAYDDTTPPGPRDRGLEAAIAAAPEDAAGYLVYADWLQQRGDPRGELIVLQHAQDRELAAELVGAHPAQLLGPLALLPANADWYCGFVRALDLGADLAAAGAWLAPLFAHPTFSFLHRFAGTLGADTDIAPLVDGAPATLRWLELSGDGAPLADLRRRLRRLPPRLMSVEHLVIDGRTYRGVAEWLAA